jgi:sulfur relay (sulfurtransferase) DsrF/TusC family protein
MGKKINRIGTTIRQKCGMDARVVTYRNANDIDVEFENGFIKQHAAYHNFTRGLIYPGDYTLEQKAAGATDRIGQKRIMCCDQECKIIEYYDSSNISVQFKDGTIVKNRQYIDFLRGAIKNPNAGVSSVKNFNLEKERVGTRRQSKSGLWMVVVEYQDSKNVTIRFECDGSVVKGKHWSAFINGEIAHPEHAPVLDGTLRVGLEREMNNGMTAKIVSYISSENISVVFLEDGTRVDGVSYSQFDNGQIINPNRKPTAIMSLQEFAINYYLKNLGFRKLEQGEWKDRGFGRMELDFYSENKNIAIEYDGAIHKKTGGLEHDIYKNSKCRDLGVVLYRLRDPSLDVLSDNNSINFVLNKENKIEHRLIDCKRELECILHNHDIIFDADYIDFGRDYEEIVQLYKIEYMSYQGNKRVGETSYSKNAKQNMTLIAYYNSQDVDVEFADGTRVCHISYNCFKKGKVRHPNSPRRMTTREQAKQRIHEKNITREGFEIEIVEYRTSQNIDVLFIADNIIKKHTTYDLFQKGAIRHPNHTPKALSEQRLHKKTITKGGYEVEIVQYRKHDDIDVLFIADGVVKKHTSYGCFMRGEIRHPLETDEAIAKQRLHEKTITNEGCEVEIIRYKNNRDLDVIFTADGVIKRHVLYSCFKSGSIAHPGQEQQSA